MVSEQVAYYVIPKWSTRFYPVQSWDYLMEITDDWVVVAFIGPGVDPTRLPTEHPLSSPTLHHVHHGVIEGIDGKRNLLYPVEHSAEGSLVWCSHCEESVPEEIETAANLMEIGEHHVRRRD